MSKSKTIQLTKPFVMDITDYFSTQIEKFGGIQKAMEWFKNVFGEDKIPYSGTHRLGEDSSTDVSTMTYDMIEEGHELIWKRFKGLRQTYEFIRITHKYGGILFFESLSSGLKSYIDCGASELTYDKHKEKCLPLREFYPIEVITKSYIDVKPWSLPRLTKITILK